MPGATDRAEEYLNQIEHLPASPTVVFELLELFKQPDCDIDRAVELIGRDPALAAELLRLTNSAAFGGGHRVTDLFEAVTRIGFYEVYRLVLAVSGSRIMMKLTGARALAVLWKHSVTTAVAAEIIASRSQDSEATAFTAALLHDIGKIVLASLEGATFVNLLAKAGDSEQSLVEAEREAFGVDHAEIGAKLLSRWNVTQDLVMAARFHHAPASNVPHARLAATVHLANVIAYALDNTALPPAEFRSGAASIAVLGLSTECLPELIQETHGALQKEAALLNL